MPRRHERSGTTSQCCSPAPSGMLLFKALILALLVAPPFCKAQVNA